jgi:hypothetical protein
MGVDTRRRRTPLSYLLPAILGGALIALFVIWMSGRRTDLAERTRPAAGAFDASGAAAMTVEQMAARRTDAAFVGQRVFVEGATVDRVVGDYLFWLGASGSGSVPVVLTPELEGRQAEPVVQVRAGQHLSLVGTVRRVEDAPASAMRLLSAEQAAEFSAAGVYVAAENVRGADGTGDPAVAR